MEQERTRLDSCRPPDWRRYRRDSASAINFVLYPLAGIKQGARGHIAGTNTNTELEWLQISKVRSSRGYRKIHGNQGHTILISVAISIISLISTAREAEFKATEI